MKLVIPKGATSRIVTVFIQANNVATGAGLSGLVHTSSIVGGYVREGGTGVALAVDEDVTTEGTYQAPSAAGKVRIGTPANMRPGTYELHFHNDLWASGAEGVVITLGGATNMADLTLEIQLSDPAKGLGAPSNLDATIASRLAPTTAGRTLVVDAAGLADANMVKAGPTGSGTAQTARDLGGQLDAAVSTRSSHSAADVWTVATRVLTAGTNIALAKGVGVTGFNDLDAAGVRAAVGLASANLDTQLAALAGYIDAEVATILSVVNAIKAVTDLLPNGGALSSLATASALSSAQTDLTTLLARLSAARAGYLDNLSGGAVALASVCTEARLAELAAGNIPADVDTVLSRLSAARAGYLDNLSAGATALEATLTAMKGGGWSTQTLVNLSSRLPAALTGAGNVPADVLAINGVTAAAVRLALSAGQIIPGTVDNTGHTPTSTVFEADDITEATADHFIGRVALWTTGALAGQATTVTDYALVSGRGRFTVDAMTEAPGNNDTFILI